MSTTVSEMENIPHWINRRLDTAKKKINKLEDIATKTIQTEKHKEKKI